MRFIIYVDNAHQYMMYMRALQKNCNAAYRAQSVNLYPSFKKYIDKLYALCNSQFLKN